MKVCKFGGSSLASVAQLRWVHCFAPGGQSGYGNRIYPGSGYRQFFTMQRTKDVDNRRPGDSR